MHATTAAEFVLVSSQRTGSTLLARSLDSVPEIFCAGEIFHFGANVHHREYLYPYLKSGRDVLAKFGEKLLQKKRIGRHLAHFYSRAGTDVKAVGFKLMVSQANRYPSVMPWLRRRRVISIFLYRRNTFDAALSYCKAEITGRFHSDRVTKRANAEPVTIGEAEFRRCFNHCAADRKRLLELHGSLGGVLFAYEDMVLDWNRTIASIGEHLDLDGLRVPMSLEKISDNEGTAIANEVELRARFAGSKSEA